MNPDNDIDERFRILEPFLEEYKTMMETSLNENGKDTTGNSAS